MFDHSNDVSEHEHVPENISLSGKKIKRGKGTIWRRKREEINGVPEKEKREKRFMYDIKD